jgi:predicted short-subunit dehydrogenase-like oxidoreductase (DUF2520 family)
VGQPLARLLAEKLHLDIHCVLNRSIESAQRACDFIGAGKPIDSFTALSPADYTLITTPDYALQRTAEILAKSQKIKKNMIFFQCSGSIPSSALHEIKNKGALIASFHPIKSFVDTQRSLNTFEGTYCALEGDQKACKILEGWAIKLGANPFYIQTDKKLIYHSSLVFACNYLISLAEIAFLSLEEAGVSRDISKSLLQPFMENTLTQLFEKDTAKALSGPIARGEIDVVQSEINVLTIWRPNFATLYKSLGEIALTLAEKKGSLTTQDAHRLKQILGA